MKERIITALFLIPIFLLFLFLGREPFVLFVVVLTLIALKEVIDMKKNKKEKTKLFDITMMYVLLGFSMFIFLGLRETFNTMLFVMLIIWVTDSGAYFVGKKLGKRKIAPNISPNKTVEGSIGGIIAAVLVAALYELIFNVTGNYVSTLLLAFAISIVGQIGDLLESKIKREFGVKDSGKILPGHGGIFDRFDSLILVSIVLVPILWIFS